jgi:hypothetical protein
MPRQASAGSPEIKATEQLSTAGATTQPDEPPGVSQAEAVPCGGPHEESQQLRASSTTADEEPKRQPEARCTPQAPASAAELGQSLDSLTITAAAFEIEAT